MRTDLSSDPFPSQADQDFAVLFAVGAQAPHARWDDIAKVSGVNLERVKGSLDRLQEGGLIEDPHWHGAKSCEALSEAGRRIVENS